VGGCVFGVEAAEEVAGRLLVDVADLRKKIVRRGISQSAIELVCGRHGCEGFGGCGRLKVQSLWMRLRRRRGAA
jgi:hypothetical protein